MFCWFQLVRYSKPEIFEIPRIATINVHRGIAPAYRGQRTIFWSLYFADFDHIGITVHLVDRGIDTGPILAHGFPDLHPGDSEATILAKDMELAAELVSNLLTAAKAGQLHGVRQTGDSRCFYNRDERVWKYLWYMFLRAVNRRTDSHSSCSRPHVLQS